MRALPLLALLAAVAVPVAAAAAKPPAAGAHHTAAGTAAARRALLRPSELGAGWTRGKTPKQVGGLTCAGSAPSLAGVVELGSAVSPTYRRSPSGPFLSQTAYVYGSADQAARFWRRVAGRAALSCLAAGVAGGSTKDVTFHVTKKRPLPAPAGRQSAAYRVVGEATTSLQKVVVYVDVVLVRRGDAISELGWSSFAAPVPPSLERRLARAAARRL